MSCNYAKVRTLWSKQKISNKDVNYHLLEQKRESLSQLADITKSCMFMVDVFKCRYDFASENFTDILDFKPFHIKTIQKQGDLLEDKIHPQDREQLLAAQIAHGQFIYSLEPECRNDYRTVYQYRMLNAKRQYINVISRHQVLFKEHNNKAWIILGMLDIAADQTPMDCIKHSTLNLRTGEFHTFTNHNAEKYLSIRETEILQLIQQGFLSKEIADKLNISIHTVNNHRKNILSKLNADNSIEALNFAKKEGILNPSMFSYK